MNEQGGATGPGTASQDDVRLGFEVLLSRLSATFIHLPADEVDGQIERGLKQIVEFLGIDRSSVACFSADGSELVVTHSYSVPGVAPFPRINIAALWPWYTAKVRAGVVLRFSRLPDELPAEAIHERGSYPRGGLPRSHLVIPFNVGETVLGGLGFGSFRRVVDWPEELVLRLSLVGEVIANALARKAAAEKEAQLREQLILAGRITLLGELTASIAHEVNQPLCAIAGNAGALRRLLKGEKPNLAEARAAVEDIAQDAQRAAAVIARTRSLFQRGPAARAPLDINTVIREVMAVTRARMAWRAVTVKLELAEGLPAVPGDRTQVQQVVLNLLNNAAEAMAHLPPEARQVVVRSAPDGSGVTVAVQDVGAGLQERDLGRIFEAFFTTRPGGMGMGLAICKSVVEAHGGRILAASGIGVGTTVQFTLPGWGAFSCATLPRACS